MNASNLKPLSSTDLRTLAPSIFAEAPHKSRSDNYGFVPTIDVVKKMIKADYVPVQANQSTIRGKDVKGRFNFTKHMVRFQQRKFVEADRVVGGLVPEVVLINSHDGSSSFVLQAGLFRLICSNGMIVQDQDHGTIRVQHSGKITDRVLEAADMILEQAPKIIAVTKEWDAIKLSERQRIALAKQVIEMRYKTSVCPVSPKELLTPRRNEDEAPTLWRTFNILQENIINGGLAGQTPNGRNTKTRPVRSVKDTLNMNRGLWELADAFARRA